MSVPQLREPRLRHQGRGCGSTWPAAAFLRRSASCPRRSVPRCAASAPTAPNPKQLYTSQAYEHKPAVGPVYLDIVAGKGLGWRAARDVPTGELLLVSLPLAVLYGSPGEPPTNEELVGALATLLQLPLARAPLPPVAAPGGVLLRAGAGGGAGGAGAAGTDGGAGVEAAAAGSRGLDADLEQREQEWLELLMGCCEGLAAQAARAAAPAAGGVAAGGAADGGPAGGGPAAAAARGQRGGAGGEAEAVREARALLELLQRAQRLVAWQTGGGAGGGDVGGGGGSAGAPDTPSAQPQQPPVLPPPPHAPGGPQGLGITRALDGTAAAAEPGREAAWQRLLPELVARYSYAEGREDPAVAELLDVAPASVVGLWPEAALLNHSCAPNASLLVVGGALYVRAGRAILEGEEVCVCYLGEGRFRDVADRRSSLQRSHGFTCACPRCAMEQRHWPTRRYPQLEGAARARERVEQALRAVREERQWQQEQQKQQSARMESSDGSASGPGGSSSASQQLVNVFDAQGVAAPVPVNDDELTAALVGQRRPGWGAGLQRLLDAVFGAGRFTTDTAPDNALLRQTNTALDVELRAALQAALTAQSRPRQQQAALLQRLQGLLAEVERSCEALEVPQRGRNLVLASVYGVVQLAGELADLPGPETTPETRLELRRAAAAAVEAAAPGSDAHVFAAVRVMDAARAVYGAAAPEARRAELAAAAAHSARYGRELLREPGLLREMVGARRRLITGSSLAASMGAIAWVQQVDGTVR